MEYALLALASLLVGAVLTWLLLRRRRPPTEELAPLLDQVRSEQAQRLAGLVHEIQAAFGEISQKALAANSEQFLRLAATKLTEQMKQGELTLEAKKKLIDETIKQIATRLGELSTSLQTLEKERRQDHGTLIQHLENAAKVTGTLQQTTAQLREALANPQRRGQWGERMAEDVLRLAGFVEGVNYVRQSTTAGGDRPDFTFPLPQDRKVNMDVKFPLPNYLKYLEAEDDAAREQYKRAFLRDMRSRIKEVTTREYIDPAAGTVDYVLVFVPNEQVYAFLHEHDPTLLDDALRQKVVLCSPLTLYALLAVIRQAAEHYRLEQTSQQILTLLAEFQKEWGKYTEVLEKLGKTLEQAMKHYETLTTTRTRKLERQLDRIEDLRRGSSPALPPAEADPDPQEP